MIPETFQEDAGKYTCAASSVAGTASSTAELIVRGNYPITLKCLKIGTLKTIDIPYIPNRKLWFLGEPVFKCITIRLYCTQIWET